MKSKVLFYFMLSLTLVILACTGLLFSIRIGNVPEWISGDGGMHFRAFSSWSDWQEGDHLLATLLAPSKAEKKQYNGKFMIGLRRNTPTSWDIVFADGTTSSFTLFLGMAPSVSSTIIIPQPDPKVFEFTAQIHNHAYGGIKQGVSDLDMALPDNELLVGVSVYIELREETEEYSRYQYRLTLDNGSVLIDTELTALRFPWFSGNNRPDWLPSHHYFIEMGDYHQTPYGPYSVFYLGRIHYVYYISGKITETNPYTALRQEEIDNQQRRVLYSVYGAPPDSNLHYIEAHRNTRETVVFRFMDKDKGVLEEGTGWINRQEDLDTW